MKDVVVAVLIGSQYACVMQINTPFGAGGRPSSLSYISALESQRRYKDTLHPCYSSVIFVSRSAFVSTKNVWRKILLGDENLLLFSSTLINYCSWFLTPFWFLLVQPDINHSTSKDDKA